jgi:hypothetical protein
MLAGGPTRGYSGGDTFTRRRSDYCSDRAESSPSEVREVVPPRSAGTIARPDGAGDPSSRPRRKQATVPPGRERLFTRRGAICSPPMVRTAWPGSPSDTSLQRRPAPARGRGRSPVPLVHHGEQTHAQIGPADDPLVGVAAPDPRHVHVLGRVEGDQAVCVPPIGARHSIPRRTRTGDRAWAGPKHAAHGVNADTWLELSSGSHQVAPTFAYGRGSISSGRPTAMSYGPVVPGRCSVRVATISASRYRRCQPRPDRAMTLVMLMRTAVKPSCTNDSATSSAG